MDAKEAERIEKKFSTKTTLTKVDTALPVSTISKEVTTKPMAKEPVSKLTAVRTQLPKTSILPQWQDTIKPDPISTVYPGTGGGGLYSYQEPEREEELEGSITEKEKSMRKVYIIAAIVIVVVVVAIILIRKYRKSKKG